MIPRGFHKRNFYSDSFSPEIREKKKGVTKE